jgi:hypothetical protein
VPAPGDYDEEIGGMMIARGNRSTQRKPAPVPLCPPQNPHACPDANPSRRGGRPATNLLTNGTVSTPGVITLLRHQIYPILIESYRDFHFYLLAKAWMKLQITHKSFYLSDLRYTRSHANYATEFKLCALSI